MNAAVSTVHIGAENLAGHLGHGVFSHAGWITLNEYGGRVICRQGPRSMRIEEAATIIKCLDVRLGEFIQQARDEKLFLLSRNLRGRKIIQMANISIQASELVGS